MNIACRWGFRAATNPLDKVYGFLGLFPPGTLKRVGRPDYALPTATVYAMFTADMIECEEELRPIAWWNANHFPFSTPDIPSWVFDLRTQGRQFADITVRISPVFPPKDDNIAWYMPSVYYAYNASCGSTIDWNQLFFEADSGHLKLTGQFVDDICIVGAPLESNDPETKNVSDQEIIGCIKDWIQQIERSNRERELCDGSEGILSWPDSFWRELIGDLVGENLYAERRATTEDLAAVQCFIRVGERAPVCQQIFATMTYRSAALTAHGHLLFCPRHSLVGDQVWLFHGGQVPFVIRQAGKGSFRSIGPAYVDGFMDGQAIREGVKQNITLI